MQAVRIAASVERRVSDRGPTRMPALVRARGEIVPVTISDVSTTGCAIVSSQSLPKGTRLWVRLPALEIWPAEVVWSNGRHCGLRFDRPLHPEVAASLSQAHAA